MMLRLKKCLTALCAVVVFCSAFVFQARAADTAAVNVIETDIRIGASDYRSLVSSEQKKQHNVSVSAGGRAYEAAQINIRGYSSRMFGLQTPTKRIPFELTFSAAQSFGGLENASVKFINSFYPYRLIAEYLALDLFAYAGIPTPAHSFAFIRFNDVDFGLYIAVEDVNRQFLSKQYADPSHAAYKATFDTEKEAEYIESEWFGRLFEKVSGSRDNLSALIGALDRGDGYEQYINVDEWLRFFACVAVTGGDGSVFTEKNNFVLYDNNGRFDLIPWDLSEAFSGKKIPDGINRFYLWMDEDSPNPLFDLIMRDPANKERYLAYIRTFTEGFLSPSAMEARYNAVLDAIAPYLPRDHSVFLNSEHTLAELRSDSPDSFSNLRYMLGAYYENLNAQLEGKADAFAVNERFAEFYALGDDVEGIVSACETRSPLLDPTLPETIARQGRKADIGERGGTYLLLGVCGALAAVCVIASLLILKRKERAGGVEAPVKSLLQSVKNGLMRHRVMLGFFLFFAVYEWVFALQFGGPKISEYNYAYHALDYSLGFCSRILPGAVSNLLPGGVTAAKVTVLETVLLALFFGCLSYFLEKLLLRFNAADRPFALLLIFLFVTGPCSFGIYVKELGMIDAWWLYCAVIVFFLLSKKKLWPLIVVFAFVLMLIYHASILSFAPFLVIVLLYRAIVEPEAGSRRGLYMIAGAFAVVAIGSAVYFIGFERENIRLSFDECQAMLNARGCKGDTEEIYNLFYGYGPAEFELSPETKFPLLDQILVRMRISVAMIAATTKARYAEIAYAAFLIAPVLLLLLSFFLRVLKSGGQKPRRFVFFCMLMLFFFVVFSGFFGSTDLLRWLAHGYTLTFACFLFVLYHEPQALPEKIKPLLQKIPLPALICYCMLYAATVFHPYA